MSHYTYDPMQYRSPQRLWDAENKQWSDRWMLYHDFDITLPDGRHLHIPAGFEYDKASVPRFAWPYLPRDDNHVVIAALVHDYLYDQQQIEGEWITRKEADLHFYNIIRDSGMRWTQARLAYLAIRLGGWRYFNKTARKLNNPLYVDAES